MKTVARPERGALPSGFLLLLLAGLVSAAGAQVPVPVPADIMATKHNLSVSGPGPVRALTETRICVFCHTPHNAAPRSPLWNRRLEPRAYQVYASPTLRAGPLPQPSGPTKLCLSCHDGTIAMGAVLNPAGGIAMAGSGFLPTGSLSNFGVDLSGHHPVSFPYQNALPSTELAPSPPIQLAYGGQDEVHCITCHDSHKDVYGKFLRLDNRYSALCITCHQIEEWSSSAHATSTASVVGVLPIPPKTWPTYTRLNEWGCETCHTPHFAPTAAELLNFTDAPPDPFSCTSGGCHGSGPPPTNAVTGAAAARPVARLGPRMVDIRRQVEKPSAHRQSRRFAAITSSRLVGAQGGVIRDVTCTDCHDPHLVNKREAEAPDISGMLFGVSGVDRNGAELERAAYEYEVCFKCHGDNASDMQYIPRVRGTTNTRLAFDPTNPSYHPVVGIGRELNVPSLPSQFEPAMSASAMIYCTSCHADDEQGSRGPHGSAFPPILRERYVTTDHTPESFDSYALCYRCHNRSSILGDRSFRTKGAGRTTASGGGHRGHLAAGAPCSACHDPHGVSQLGPGRTGSHTHLINFDSRIVLGRSAGGSPTFNDTGTFSGSCNLLCHGVDHENLSYP
jgi:predicted CXXCH cytochrome family protein